MNDPSTDDSRAVGRNLRRPPVQNELYVGRPNVGDRGRFMELVNESLDRVWFTNNGPLATEFERKLANFLDVPECVVMVNGTVALEIAIRALGLRDEVIVPSYTFVATAHAVSWQGLKPVFADIDAITHNISPESVLRLISPKTSGIIGVHLWGRPAPIERLQEIADGASVALLFDAAHAFGVKYKGTAIGNLGDAQVFSFHSTKFFNSFEGGAVCTTDTGLAAKMRLMRNFGFQGFDNVIHEGINGKMTEVCAAMGLVNLESISTFVDVNRRNYEQYRTRIAEIPKISLLPLDDVEDCNYQYVVIELDDEYAHGRDELVTTLHSYGVIARRYFWPGVHRMEPYRSLDPNAGLVLKNTETVAARVVVLPTGLGISEKEVDFICDILALWAVEAEEAPDVATHG